MQFTVGARWRELLPRDDLKLLQTIVLLSSLGIVVLTAGLPLYSSQVGATGFEVGGLFAIGALTTALPRPIIGHALDVYGRKTFLRAGIACVAVSMAVFAVSHDVTALFVASTVQGLGTGTLLLSAYTMTADITSHAGRGGSFGSTEQAQYRGGLYGGALAVPILLLTGFSPSGELHITDLAWTIMFVVFAIGAAVAWVIASVALKETYAEGAAEEHPDRAVKIHRQLYTLMAIVAITSASTSGIAPFILRYIQDHITQNLFLLSLAYLPASLVWGFLPSRMGQLADRFGRRLPIAISLTMSGLFSAVIPALTTILPLTAFATVEAICYSAAVPAEQAMVADMTGGRRRGTGFGLYTLAQSSGRVVGPLVMGALYDQFRSGPFVANAMILVVGSVLVLFFLRESPTKTAAVSGR